MHAVLLAVIDKQGPRRANLVSWKGSRRARAGWQQNDGAGSA
jgi:hypothetical protein